MDYREVSGGCWLSLSEISHKEDVVQKNLLLVILAVNRLLTDCLVASSLHVR